MGPKVICACVMLVLTSIAWTEPQPAGATDTINAVIGDASWTDGPPQRAEESARIRTHLRYVLALLRARDVSALAPSQRTNRAASLNALERYIERGEFPRRTEDAYAGRRPRFIDDRSVQCAVGQLLADSGYAALAQAIATSHEYAYVVDIEVPALGAWAETHGFTVDELATIQPSYAPPDERTLSRYVESYAWEFAPMCAPDATTRATLTVHIEVDTKANSKIVSTPKGRYAACVLGLLRRELPDQFRHDQGGKPRRRLEFDVNLELPSLQDLFAAGVDRQSLWNACFPRPGPIPTSATMEATATPTSIRVVVETQPRNHEIERCLETHYEDMLDNDLPRVGTVRWRRPIPVMTREERENSIAKLSVSTYTERCPGAPDLFKISFLAAVDDPWLTVHVSSPRTDFNTCMAKLTRRHLRNYFTARYGLSRFRGLEESASRPEYRELSRIDTPIDVRLDVSRSPYSTASEVKWDVKQVQPAPLPPHSVPGEQEVAHIADALAYALAPDCAPDRTSRSSVQVHVVPPTNNGMPTVSGTAADRYAKCVLERVQKILPALLAGRGRYATWQSPVDVTIDLPARQDALQREVERLWAPRECVPRPGAIPARATVTATATARGVSVDVETQPRNREVDRCMKIHFTNALASERSRVGTLKASATLAIEPGAAEEIDRGLQIGTFLWMNDYLKSCPTKADTFAITYTAAIDAPQLSVTVKGPDATFDTCLAGVLATAMRSHFVSHYNPADLHTDETKVRGYQAFFRIDAPVDVRLTVTRDPAMAHDKEPRWTVTRVR